MQATLESVCTSMRRTPARRGWITSPGVSGYAPEAVFEHIVGGPVRSKAAKAQGPRSGAAPLSMLVVDLGHSGLRSELEDAAYRRRFRGALDRALPTYEGGYDVLAFCESRGGALRLHWLFGQPGARRAAAAAFGD